MKAITNKILNHKEVIIIGSVVITFVTLIVYNILVHGIH
jgi:hypothetical protein